MYHVHKLNICKISTLNFVYVVNMQRNACSAPCNISAKYLYFLYMNKVSVTQIENLHILTEIE
jgi:hypothetical protein